MADQAASTVATSDPPATAQGAEAAQPAFYVGTYKKKEDAEKGLAEKDSTINRLKSEVDKMRAEVAKHADHRDLLGKITEAVSAAKPKPEVDTKARLEELAKVIDDKGGPAVVDLMIQVQRDIEANTEQRTKAETAELRKELAALRDSLVEYDPEVRQHRETIEKLREAFPEVSDRKVLLRMAKLMGGNAEQPDRPPLAGTTAPSRLTEEPDADPIAGAAVRAEYEKRYGKYTDAQWAEIVSMRRDRMGRK